jgi:hypothetical protein
VNVSREQSTSVSSTDGTGDIDRPTGLGATAGEERSFEERLEVLEPVLMAFGDALGGDPGGLDDFPFTEGTAERLPASLFVAHDRTALELVTEWLGGGFHVGITSDAGSGKSALRANVERELRPHGDYVAASVDLATATERRIRERLVRACQRRGYEIDPDDYWEVADGIPWTTDGVERAVADVVDQATTDGRTVYLLADGFEHVTDAQLDTLRQVADAGVRLFVLGRSESRFRRNELAGDLGGEMKVLDGFEGFDERDVAEYCARSMARFRGEEFDGSPSGLFSGDAISFVTEQTGGNPRAVRLACLDLFTRAAYAWHQSDADIDQVTITSGLMEQELDFEEESVSIET